MQKMHFFKYTVHKNHIRKSRCSIYSSGKKAGKGNISQFSCIYSIWTVDNGPLGVPRHPAQEPTAVLEAKPNPIRRIPAGQRPQARIERRQAVVPTPKSQHSGDEVAEPEPGPQSHRASLGSSEVPRSWEEV